MKSKTPSLLAAALALPVAGSALAAPVVDGTRDAAYGPALAVQTVQTNFGNNGDPNGFGGGGLILLEPIIVSHIGRIKRTSIQQPKINVVLLDKRLDNRQIRRVLGLN